VLSVSSHAQIEAFEKVNIMMMTLSNQCWIQVYNGATYGLFDTVQIHVPYCLRSLFSSTQSELERYTMEGCEVRLVFDHVISFSLRIESKIEIQMKPSIICFIHHIAHHNVDLAQETHRTTPFLYGI
jgi:hypothetical protein